MGNQHCLETFLFLTINPFNLKPSLKHSCGSKKFPDQNLRWIVHKLGLNSLEFLNQTKNISVSSPIKIWGKSVKAFICYDRTYKKRLLIYTYIYVHCIIICIMNTDAFKQLIPILTLIIIKMLPKMNNSIFLCSKLIIHFCQVVTHNTKQNRLFLHKKLLYFSL